MPEHDFNKYFNFKGPRVSWNKALTALDYRNYRWRYFYLDNPPEDKEKPVLYTDQGHIARKNYSEVQKLILDLAKKSVEKYQTQNRDELKRITRAYLEQKKKEAEIRETRLFNELVGISFNLSEKVYTDMINRSKQELKASLDNNSPLETMTTPEFWTRLANGLLDIANGQISNASASAQNFSLAIEANKMALAYVLISREFAEELKVDHNQGIFSRHLALKDSTYADDINGFKISENSLRVLGEDVFKAIDEDDLFQMLNMGNNTEFDFSNLKDIGEQLISELSQIVKEALQIYFNVDPSGKNSNEYLKIFKPNKKNIQSSSVSTTIRTKVSKAIDDFIDRQNWTIEQKNYFGQHFSYRFVNSRNQVYFEAISKKYNKKNAFYEKQIETIEHLKKRAMKTKSEDFKTYLKNSRSAERELVSNLLKTLIDSIDKFGKKKLETLDLQSLGQLNINNYVKNCKVNKQQYFKDKNDFYSKVVAQLKGDAKTYFANDNYVKYLWKSFRASNSNAYITGFLGEMGGLYQTQKLLKTEGLWTGGSNVYGSGSGTNKRTNYGDSVNDLRFFSQELKQNIGVNIKHYTETNTDEMTLYPGKTDEGISIFKDTMRKYINVEDLNLMRFVLENSYYFQEDTKLMYNIEERLLAHHIPEFYRVKDHARGTSENMFFLINNAFYPLTFIYDRVLAKLDNLLDKENDDALIQTTFKTSQPVKSNHYKDLETARKDWEEADWRLGNKRHGKYNMFVRTTGLNINLVKLNLF